MNQYAYVENAPTVAVDPSGLQRLAPLGRNGAPERDVDRAELERLMTPRGGQLPNEVKEMLNDGCIGLTRAYQGAGVFYPEDAPNTNCYLEESLAKARKCPRCCRNFVFAKQGKWSDPYMIGVERSRTKRPIPRNAISNVDGRYNYIVYFPSTRTYAWINHYFGQPGVEPQKAFIREAVIYNDPVYPHTIWCSTCKRKTGLR